MRRSSLHEVKQAELEQVEANCHAGTENVRVRELTYDEVEIDKLREVNSVRREFAVERKHLRED